MWNQYCLQPIIVNIVMNIIDLINWLIDFAALIWIEVSNSCHHSAFLSPSLSEKHLAPLSAEITQQKKFNKTDSLILNTAASP